MSRKAPYDKSPFRRATWKGFTDLDRIPPAEMIGSIAPNYTGKPPVALTITYIGVLLLDVELLIGFVRAIAAGKVGHIISGTVLLLVFLSITVLITFPLLRVYRYWLLVRRHRRADASTVADEG